METNLLRTYVMLVIKTSIFPEAVALKLIKVSVRSWGKRGGEGVCFAVEGKGIFESLKENEIISTNISVV